MNGLFGSIPPAVRATGGLTMAAATVGAAAWAPTDAKAAWMFMTASAWGVAAMLAWGGLAGAMLMKTGDGRPHPGRLGAIFGWAAVKLGLIIGGMVALAAAAPLTRGQRMGLVAGIPLVLAVLTAQAVVARFSRKGTLDLHSGRTEAVAPKSASEEGIR